MKKIIAVAGAFALAACGGSDVDEPVEADMGDDAAMADDAGGMAMGSDATGTYTMTDGTVTTVIDVDADGTYSVTEDGTAIQSGTWTDDERGTCFVGEGAGETCYERTVGADGNVTMTDLSGEATTWEYES